MRFKFDLAKSQICRKNPLRGIGFEEVQQLFQTPFYLDSRNDDPMQFRAIGFVNDHLFTVIFEIRTDRIGEFYHLITLWKSTRQEKLLYEENFG